jgi:hypothetical protein
MRVELRFVRQDLFAHEFGSRLTEQSLLISEVVTREQEIRIQRSDQERSATRHVSYRCCHGSSG